MTVTGPDVLSPLAGAVNDGLGAPVSVARPDETVFGTITAIIRQADEDRFSAGDFSGSVQRMASIAFATSDCPDADKGWRVTDGDGTVWEMRAVTLNGRGRSRAPLVKVLP